MLSTPGWRHLLLICFFAGVVALEVAHGVFRISTNREQRSDQILGDIEQRLDDLATALRPPLEDLRRHARFFACAPASAELLSAPTDEEVRARYSGLTGPYLVAFAEIDRIRILDAEGRPRFLCQKNGNSVAILPAARLAEIADDPGSVRLATAAGRGGVGISSLEYDATRVEVAERDRQIIHHASLVCGAAGDVLGSAVVTAYASPLLERVRSFRSIDGGETYLLDAQGNFLAHPLREREPGGATPGNFWAERRESGAASLAARRTLLADGATALSVPLAGDPAWTIVALLPADRLAEAASRGLWGETVWIVAAMLAVTIVCASATAFFMRLSFRELRLREGQRFLEQIRQESEKFRTLLEGAGDMILVVDAEHELVRESNARAREQLRVPSRREDPPLPLSECFGAESLARVRAALQAALRDFGRSIPAGEEQLRTTVGRELPVDVRMAAFRLGEGGVAVQVSLRDLTHLKGMERQLRITERLSSLGQLTAGVAHEINNPLEGIGNYLALLERDDGSPQRRRWLEQVKHGFERIRDLVRDLSAFGRHERGAGITDIGEVARRSVAMLRYSKELKDVEVRFEGLDRPVLVQGDAGRLEQVLLNLFINAAQAMGGRGAIQVAANSAPASGPGEVEISIDDSGPGIPEALLPSIFDPFVSSKESSGLGLAISHGIIRVHGGTLTAENRPQGGARFIIRLPIPQASYAGSTGKEQK